MNKWRFTQPLPSILATKITNNNKERRKKRKKDATKANLKKEKFLLSFIFEMSSSFFLFLSFLVLFPLIVILTRYQQKYGCEQKSVMLYTSKTIFVFLRGGRDIHGFLVVWNFHLNHHLLFLPYLFSSKFFLLATCSFLPLLRIGFARVEREREREERTWQLIVTKEVSLVIRNASSVVVLVDVSRYDTSHGSHP